MPLWGNDGTVAARPKWANTDNSRTYGNTYPVRVEEVDTVNTKTQDIHAGWVSGKAYVDTAGDHRYKFETLVAMRGMTNTNIYTWEAITGHINVATASAVIHPQVVRTNTLQAGDITVTANRSRVVGHRTTLTSLVSGSVIRYASTHFGTVNNVVNSTIMYLTSNTVTASANSVFFKVVDSRDVNFSTALSVGMVLGIANSHTIKAVQSITNSTQATLTATAGIVGANSTLFQQRNITGPRFFHA